MTAKNEQNFKREDSYDCLQNSCPLLEFEVPQDVVVNTQNAKNARICIAELGPLVFSADQFLQTV